MLGILSRELVAAEGHYHHSCYKLYIYKQEPNTVTSEQKSIELNEDEKYKIIENMAYNKLFDYIRIELFQNPQVMKLADLMQKLIGWMGGINVKQSTGPKHTFEGHLNLNSKIL